MNEIKESTRPIPPFGYRFLTPFYDSILMFILRDRNIKKKLVSLMDIEEGQTVLDLGCGTATLTIMVKEDNSRSPVIGLDVDIEVIDIARKKATNAGTDLMFLRGSATCMPLRGAVVDIIVSSLMLHHLDTGGKRGSIREARRVLKETGDIYVMDFDRPHNVLMYLISQVLGRFEEASGNVRGLIPVLMGDKGFQVKRLSRFSTVFSTVSIYSSINIPSEKRWKSETKYIRI